MDNSGLIKSTSSNQSQNTLMIKIAILSSHNGSGFDAIHEAIANKTLDAEVSLIISNNTNSNILKKAKKYEIDNFLVNAKTDENPDEKIHTLLKKSNCNLVFLSGYMKKLSAKITKDFHLINSHPSLLPKYGGVGMYGRFVHEAVIKNKEERSGVTIHTVNEVYDDGKIILQKSLDLKDNETLESLEIKIKELERMAIVEVIKNLQASHKQTFSSLKL